jgi:PqqA peptide cyclase
MSADATVAERRENLRGKMAIDYVMPDYYDNIPKTNMGGWGQKSLLVTPDGSILPCHAAQTIPGLGFQRAGEHPLREIWETGPAFQSFRGTSWMHEPCATCTFKEQDFGGCRCQALAVSGNVTAADPACHLSPDHARMRALAEAATMSENTFTYRRYAVQPRYHNGFDANAPMRICRTHRPADM